MADPLPTCQCVQAQPPFDRLTSIYCVLLQILQNGGGGGSITLSQISDMSAFWKNANAQTPAANTYLTSNGVAAFAAVPFANISITVSQISNLSNGSVANFLTSLPAPMAANNIPSVNVSGAWTNVGVTQMDGTVTPVTSGTFATGVLTALS